MVYIIFSFLPIISFVDYSDIAAIFFTFEECHHRTCCFLEIVSDFIILA